MNTSLIRVLALSSLIAAAGPSSVMAQVHLRFTIPFAFTVGTQSFAAGDYRVAELSPSLFMIESTDLGNHLMFMGHPGSPAKADGKTTLTFHRYGESYFLARISDENKGIVLPVSVKEKELIASRSRPKPLDIIASSR